MLDAIANDDTVSFVRTKPCNSKGCVSPAGRVAGLKTGVGVAQVCPHTQPVSVTNVTIFIIAFIRFLLDRQPHRAKRETVFSILKESSPTSIAAKRRLQTDSTGTVFP